MKPLAHSGELILNIKYFNHHTINKPKQDLVLSSLTNTRQTNSLGSVKHESTDPAVICCLSFGYLLIVFPNLQRWRSWFNSNSSLKSIQRKDSALCLMNEGLDNLCTGWKEDQVRLRRSHYLNPRCLRETPKSHRNQCSSLWLFNKEKQSYTHLNEII